MEVCHPYNKIHNNIPYRLLRLVRGIGWFDESVFTLGSMNIFTVPIAIYYGTSFDKFIVSLFG